MTEPCMKEKVVLIVIHVKQWLCLCTKARTGLRSCAANLESYFATQSIPIYSLSRMRAHTHTHTPPINMIRFFTSEQDNLAQKKSVAIVPKLYL